MPPEPLTAPVPPEPAVPSGEEKSMVVRLHATTESMLKPMSPRPYECFIGVPGERGLRLLGSGR